MLVATPFASMNFIGPALGAGLFVAIMSLVPHPAQRYLCSRRSGRVCRRRIRRLGTDLSGAGDPCGLPRLAVVPSHRHRVVDACGLGLAPSPYRPSHLATRPDLLPGLHDLRLADRRLVPGGCAFPGARAQDGNRGVICGTSYAHGNQSASEPDRRCSENTSRNRRLCEFNSIPDDMRVCQDESDTITSLRRIQGGISGSRLWHALF